MSIEKLLLPAVLALWVGVATAEAQDIAQPLGLPPAPRQIAGTPTMRKLGEQLFFDRSLAANGTLSCAMCHIPTQAFASNQSALSIGMEGRSLRRNAPSLYNVVFKKYLFHDGRETDLTAQVWGPLLAPDEMGNTGIGPLLTRLRVQPDYRAAFDAAFPGEGVSMTTVGRAIAAYEATLLLGESRFDKAIFGGDRNALSTEEWRGYDIFISKGCASCHKIESDTALFTDQSWHNTGVAFRQTAQTARVQVQLAPGLVKEVDLSGLRLAPAPPRDIGRFEITKDPADRWAYTTPMLRGVSKSAPYMHDGSLSSLEEVIDFYDVGGGPNPVLDAKIRPLNLTREEKAALLAFLRAL
ncbi:MAG: cytochrome-c peroxidase [Methylocystis sp.]|uniref:cytochrome-c peroxidase n=1 Tax=Methylocystis sp. TaxID=1911079 RepID=UPI003DA286B6